MRVLSYCIASEHRDIIYVVIIGLSSDRTIGTCLWSGFAKNDAFEFHTFAGECIHD